MEYFPTRVKVLFNSSFIISFRTPSTHYLVSHCYKTDLYQTIVIKPYQSWWSGRWRLRLKSLLVLFIISLSVFLWSLSCSVRDKIKNNNAVSEMVLDSGQCSGQCQTFVEYKHFQPQEIMVIDY